MRAARDRRTRGHHRLRADRPIAFERVNHAIRQEGCRTVTPARADVPAVAGDGGSDALVYDLEPADLDAVAFVRHLHNTRPDWPVWIYYPPRGSFPERAAELGSLRWLCTTPQMAGALGERQIAAHVGALVAAVPRIQFVRILDGLLRPIPVEVKRFLTRSVEHLGGPYPRNTDLRQGIGESEADLRRLERICQGADLPGPKRMKDDATLAFLAFKTLAFGLPLLKAAQQVGLSRKEVDRLFVRALGQAFQWAPLEPRARFEFVIMALGATCHVGQREVEETVRQVVRERAG